MIFLKIRPATATLTIYYILLVSLSKSVCGAEIRNTYIEALLKQRPPLNRGYIKTPEGRRHATEITNIRCRLWQNCFVYQDDRGNSHQWECSFDDPGLQANFDGHSNKIIVGVGDENLNEWLELNGAVSGSTMLVLSHADLLIDKMIVNKTSVLAIDEYSSDGLRFSETVGGLRFSETVDFGIPREDQKPFREVEGAKPEQPAVRRLTSYTGTLNTLVVRVNANDNSPPPATNLSEDIFGDEYCLKSQYNKCSYGQLQIQEYVTGTVSNVPTAINAPGVIDISVDANAEGNNYQTMQDLANLALQEKLGTTDPGSIFDLVLFCMPPGMDDWLAYAYIGRWDSYYNNEWCQAVTSQMHEVGHSIGLHHSGEYFGTESEKEYGDGTGMMGFSYREDDTAMCFNPAKSWEVGWYADKQIELNVDTDLSAETTSYLLNGVVDYKDESVGRYIVVKIGNFYIGYNRAASFNGGVKEAPDRVTITEKRGGDESSAARSKLIAKLSVGDTYVIQVTEYLDVFVKYASNSDGKDAVVDIKIGEPVVCQGEYDAEVEVVVTTDNFPLETSWGIVDSGGQYIYKVPQRSLTLAGTYTENVTGLCRGLRYYFIIEDSYGDGICCSAGSGSFRGTFEGSEIFSGGDFDEQETKPFILEPASAPTSSPTAGSTPACADNATKEFDIEIKGTSKTKNCAWVASKKKAKIQDYCTMKVEVNGNSENLNAICKETCDLCTSPNPEPTDDCVDNVTKEFDIEVDGTSKAKDCAWIASKNKRKRKNYCTIKVEGDNDDTNKISTICKKTCGLVGKGTCKHLKL